MSGGPRPKEGLQLPDVKVKERPIVGPRREVKSSGEDAERNTGKVEVSVVTSLEGTHFRERLKSFVDEGNFPNGLLRFEEVQLERL